MKSLQLAAAAVAALVLSACSPAKAPDQAASGGLTPIKFATDWRAEAEHGGFYEALATGEYKKRGLDVTIIQGGPAVNVPQLLATGAIDMGVGSNSFIVMNMANQHVPVKAVMAAMQSDPQVLIAHSGQGIHSIADMKGRPIMLADASITAFWIWLKAKYHFTDDQVRKYTFSDAPFLADRKAIQEGYLTSEPYTIEKAGHEKPAVFLLADEGYPGYAAMVLVNDSLITAKPQVVKAFVDATAAGWKAYLYGDPKPADALILKDNPEMTQDVLDQARAKMREKGIVLSGDAAAQGVGAMTDARWKAFFDVAASQGVYPKSMDYKSAYTLQFLPTGAK
ncbi:ABC transporter substrate-binding protein [Phenylobacterium montanum]|uniref:ABC transporter substrate-binding protein n=1 Tax=Phenylobacterium montanum TaxID=2823693 RepID=A0A975IUC5_9CAUL|nr:ABC transporter substrate-binding protein [Caulobacter sp. S6]QUD86101.1 ABC transporter substrate-binding protein [Caulobacter sp. S6]